jgi:DNA gyrase subunit A
LGTWEGKSIRFSEQDVRPTGRKTRGVIGIRKSSKGDKVVGMVVIRREGTILVATEKGYGKRTDIMQYRAQKRGGMGVMAMRTSKKVGKMVAVMEVVDSDDLMVITDRGVLIRQQVSEIRTIGRVTQGVKLIRLDEKDKISGITRVIEEGSGEEGAALEPSDNGVPDKEAK